MGDDLAGTGDQFVEEFSISSGVTLTTPDGAPAIRVVLGTRRRGSGELDHLEFAMSGPVAARLAQVLKQTSSAQAASGPGA